MFIIGTGSSSPRPRVRRHSDARCHTGRLAAAADAARRPSTHQQGIGAETALVRRAIERDEPVIDLALIRIRARRA
jgi:hypothetical protein